eukprot:6026968-Pyramimonas_sp.AAC.1
MLLKDPNITIRLSTDFFEVKDKLPAKGALADVALMWRAQHRRIGGCGERDTVGSARVRRSRLAG